MRGESSILYYLQATQHPLKLVPRDSNFKEIVHTSKQQQNLQTPVW